jgi:alanine racemase
VTQPHGPAEAVIDLDALQANLASIMLIVAPATVMAVVKADAYGHGAVEVARAAREVGVAWLGVAFPTEALALRAAGDAGPMLAWLYAPDDPHLQACIAADVDVSVSSIDDLGDVVIAGAGRNPFVHLKIDTGLGRGGCSIGDWPALVRAAREAELAGVLTVRGVWSHFAVSDEPHRSENALQIAVFNEAVRIAHEVGLEPTFIHLANTAGALVRPEARFDLVRIGIGAYGISPGSDVGVPDDLGITPVMSVCTQVAQLKQVPAGHGVSYGLTWRADRPSTLALIPLGYADGIPRSSTGAQVQIAGQRFDVVGRIAMDQFVVDVTDGDVASGDEVVIFGSGESGEPTAEDWATWSGTIPYEIVTRIGPRVRRRYKA